LFYLMIFAFLGALSQTILFGSPRGSQTILFGSPFSNHTIWESLRGSSDYQITTKKNNRSGLNTLCPSRTLAPTLCQDFPVIGTDLVTDSGTDFCLKIGSENPWFLESNFSSFQFFQKFLLDCQIET